ISDRNWSSDVCSSDLIRQRLVEVLLAQCNFLEFLWRCGCLRLQGHGLFVGCRRLIPALQLPIKITQCKKRLDGLEGSPARLLERSEERRVGKGWRGGG